MPHSTRERHIEPGELRSYAEDIVTEALRDGTIHPAIMLECVHYAVEPDLLAAMRALAAAGPAERLMIMSYATRLSEERVTVG